MKYLKQSTASQSDLIGPFVDDTDGTTAETALTIANTDIRLSVNGGNMTAKNSGGGTHDELGMYSVTYDATDTATVGRLRVTVKMTGALVVIEDYTVLEETVYDALFAASAAGELAVKLSTQGKADVNAEADTALTDYDALVPADLPTNFGDLSITATTGRVDVAAIGGTAQTANDVGADANTLVTRIPDTLSLANINAEVDTALAGYDSPTKTEMDTAFTEIKGSTWSGTTDTLEHIRNKQTDIEADTQDLQTQVGTAGAGLTDLGGMSTSMKAEVQSEVDDALDTSISELSQGAPSSTPSLRTGLMLLYMIARNKVDQTATEFEVHNAAGTVIAKKTSSDDGTTYSEANMASGP